MAPSAVAASITSSVDKANQQVEPKKKNLDDDSNTVPHAIKLVLAKSSSPPSLTIGEHYRLKKLDRFTTLWLVPVIRIFYLIFFLAALAYDTYRPWLSTTSSMDDLGAGGFVFPWWRVTMALTAVYGTVVLLALWHLPVFVPQAPFAAVDALEYVGFREVGPALIVITAIVSLFNQVWPSAWLSVWLSVTWACLLAALIAAVIYLWLCLVRTYRTTPCN
ncbi:hypothetical protein BS78_02G004200 [Paspalum vaginatum]|nr:hypothetical protein BS78_02G004200 [Paspalum vaginatum]